SASISDHHEKDIVPLHQFLRYSLSCSDQRKFQRRRITQPFKPIYEVEWQKNQWLQLDKTTNKQIEHLRRQGFTKIVVRKDKTVKKHIKYDNPNEIDVLLELSLYNLEDDFSKILYDQPELITCHQPNYFTLRRTRWWHTYKSGEARLPNWIDQDLCCGRVIMDAHSVMAAMTNYSRSSVSSFHHPRLPDTPLLSQKSSLSQLRPQNQDDSWRFKSLQYSEPHIL
ncbi:uncharacterized protein B0P05DRAFT_447962, partial [Gilbertella persicaria]|uniref:uncharacterized protein n=1 Tax=Gilbertella persicaria TaxID=101096 RepID=UPI00221FA798